MVGGSEGGSVSMVLTGVLGKGTHLLGVISDPSSGIEGFHLLHKTLQKLKKALF